MPHTRCPGSQEYRGYSPGQVTRISQTGRNAAARVTCTRCGRTFTGRVVYTSQGVSLTSASRTKRDAAHSP